MRKMAPHIVFDLDDTLYPEIEYVRSCFRFVSDLLSCAYGVPNTEIELGNLRQGGERDPIGAIFERYALPQPAKSDVVSAMRAHKPDIYLRPGGNAVLRDLWQSQRSVSVVTDGRSITQRRKLEALGLLRKVRPYISEETGFSKPSERPFQCVQKDHPDSRVFWYVADNPAKDFLAPNQLGWVTIMLRGGPDHVHPQQVTEGVLAPHHVVDSLGDICRLPGFRISPPNGG